MTATVPQHLSALQLANRIRLARAKQKDRLRNQPSGVAAKRCVADMLDEPHESILTMPVGQLLAAGHRIGRGLARRYLVAANISEHVTVGKLTARQRTALTAVLRDQPRSAPIMPTRPAAPLRSAPPKRRDPEPAPATGTVTDVYCPNCGQDVLAGHSGRCPWCSETVTGRPAGANERNAEGT